MNLQCHLAMDAALLSRLHEFAALFRDDFQRSEQALWAGVYLHGLLQRGERKTIPSLAQRVPLPSGLKVKDPVQSLQHFINQSPWDEQRLWARLRGLLAPRVARREGVFVISDLIFGKRGRQSVGVHRQYAGGHGKKTNCQIAVAVHYLGRRVHVPLALRLYLPQNWQRDADQMSRAGVPEAFQRPVRKWEIALELLDEVRREGWPGWAVAADIRYGASPEFRAGLAQRQLSYLVEVAEGDPLWSVETALAPRPPTVGELAHREPLRPLVQPARQAEQHLPRFSWVELPRAPLEGGISSPSLAPWLVTAEVADGELRYALARLETAIKCRQAVQLWKCHRWAENACQWLRENLGLDHFEGRSWRGFHHHVCLVMLAYGFWISNQLPLAEQPFAH